MRIYLAARYSRHDEMRGVRDVLTALGHEATSRWIDQHGGEQLESATTAVLNSDPAMDQQAAQLPTLLNDMVIDEFKVPADLPVMNPTDESRGLLGAFR